MFGSRSLNGLPMVSCRGAVAVLLCLAFSIAAALPAHASGTFEPQTDRPGRDYRTFFVETADPADCQDACVADGQCHAWTYVAPGYQGDLARCWLKNPAPEPSPASPCCVSGVVRGPTADAAAASAPSLPRAPGTIGGDQLRDEDWTWNFSEWRDGRGRLNAELTLGIEIGEEVVLRANCSARSGSPVGVPIQISAVVDALPPGAPISVIITANDRTRGSYQGEVYDGPVGKTALVRVPVNDPLWRAFTVSGSVDVEVAGGGRLSLLRTFYAERAGQFASLCREMMGG